MNNLPPSPRAAVLTCLRTDRSVRGVVLLGLLEALGCQARSRPVDMWIVEAPPSPRVVATRRSEALGPEVSPRHITLAGAINETLDLRFAIRVRDEPIGQPRLRIGPFTSAGGQGAPVEVRVFRLQPVPVARLPGWHLRSIRPADRRLRPLDVLVPVEAPHGGLPATLRPGETYYFWVDVDIPKGTFQGRYTSDITLTSGGAVRAAVDVDLVVWPIILPEEATIPVVAELDHRALFRRHVRERGRGLELTMDDWRGTPQRQEMDHLLRSTMRLLRDHRLTPVLHKLAPVVKLKAQGGLAVDWGQFDAVVTPCLSGRAFENRLPLRLWPMPSLAIFSSIRHRDAASSAEYPELLEHYLSACAAHFEEQGWLERGYFLLPDAAEAGAAPVLANQELARIARRADKRIAVASPRWPQDMEPYGWVDYPRTEWSDEPDIWLPPAQFYDVETMADERAAGRRTWLSMDRPPFSGCTAISAPPAYQRVLPWQAEQLGAQVLYLGCVNRWPEPVAHPSPEDCVRADPNVLLYPGSPFGLKEPVPSVRLKYLRQGLQDAAYRKVVNDHGLEHVTAALARSLAPYAGSQAYRTHFADGRPIGWVSDPAMFALARKIMAEEFVRASSAGGDVDRSGRFTRTAAWRRLMHATRRLYLQVNGTRLRLRGTPTRWEADVECALTVINRTRAPVEGTIRFVDLPEGWSAPDGGQSVTPVPPNSSRRVTLTAETATAPNASGGILRLPIEFTSRDGITQRTHARVSYASAASFRGTLRIDGDLSDWPPGAVNAVSDFRLIVGEPGGSADQDAARPRRATTGFVLRDRDNLYVAVNCKYGTPLRSVNAKRNRVVYDDLIPMGEELVEVLIDPLNAGTRSPGDLYHIVVKPLGAYLTEKGVGFEPPCGRREPWPVDIEVATGGGADRWTAELRIPLAAFHVTTTEHTIWGLNLTRFDASNREFSTWSGAVGNAYDPLSLGNLYLP